MRLDRRDHIGRELWETDAQICHISVSAEYRGEAIDDGLNGADVLGGLGVKPVAGLRRARLGGTVIAEGINGTRGRKSSRRDRCGSHLVSSPKAEKPDNTGYTKKDSPAIEPATPPREQVDRRGRSSTCRFIAGTESLGRYAGGFIRVARSSCSRLKASCKSSRSSRISFTRCAGLSPSECGRLSSAA